MTNKFRLLNGPLCFTHVIHGGWAWGQNELRLWISPVFSFRTKLPSFLRGWIVRFPWQKLEISIRYHSCRGDFTSAIETREEVLNCDEALPSSSKSGRKPERVSDICALIRPPSYFTAMIKGKKTFVFAHGFESNEDEISGWVAKKTIFMQNMTFFLHFSWTMQDCNWGQSQRLTLWQVLNGRTTCYSKIIFRTS